MYSLTERDWVTHMGCNCRKNTDDISKDTDAIRRQPDGAAGLADDDCAGGRCVEHDEDEDDEEESPRQLGRRIGASTALLAAAWLGTRLMELPLVLQLALFLPSYLVAGLPVLREAAQDLREGAAFGESVLMSVATLGALLMAFVPQGEPLFAEAVFVMLFFQVGELAEGLAEQRSERSVKALMDIRPDVAAVERQGKIVRLSPGDVTVGETIVVRPGERVPLDGVIVEGATSLDTSALTGESAPREARCDDAVTSGCVNLTGVIRVRTTSSFADSTVSRILELVRGADARRSRSEGLVERFSKVYTPIVVALAVLVAVVPPLVSGDPQASAATWLLRALTFLVVSCPCALVLSVPLTFFGGIGGASRVGVLIKGSDHLETLARADTVVFDKTGTLTQGAFSVTAVHPQLIDKDQLLHVAAHVESRSLHPIAAALRDACPIDEDGCIVTDMHELAGRGVVALVNGRRVAVGNARLMEDEGAHWHDCTSDNACTTLHVALDGTYAGHVLVADQLRPDSAATVAELRRAGVRRCEMLTGDVDEVARGVAAELGLDGYHAGLLPADKVARLDDIIQDAARAGAGGNRGSVVFVGDGINDAPVLARADVGVAMGALGSDAAIEAADVVLMDDSPSKVVTALRVARRTLRIVRENIAFAIGAKVVILVLATLGLAPLWLAVFGDVGVLVLCVLNASRALAIR